MVYASPPFPVRAALAWTEGVTLIADGHAPDGLYNEVRRSFSEEEMAGLTMANHSRNAWSRIVIPFRAVPGTYQPKQAHERAPAESLAR